ncbi:RNA polymerase sigma factor SigJ [Motilibacter rhizosphaerae]|nr:RNA polymerase sigma factor SigJ [Motilibacter rhizosphaerae]
MSTSRTPLQVYAAERPRLVAVAYAVLGDVAEAEDVVQDAWLRLERTEDIDDVAGWLVVAVARLALDVARSARRRREEYVGPWLPEPLTVEPLEDGPEESLLLREDLSLALLAVLETLSPAQRTVFVLHDVFAVPFDEVARVVGRSPAACRQLAARARADVAAQRPRTQVDSAEQQRVLAAFAAACEDGDLDELLRLLDPAVVLVSDGGGKVSAARKPVEGADHVARFLVGVLHRNGSTLRPVLVNGVPGYLTLTGGELSSVVSLTLQGGRVRGIDIVRNPDKLTRVRPSA